MSSGERFLRQFPEVPDEGLCEIRVPRPEPGDSVYMPLVYPQLDCCDWAAFFLHGFVQRGDEVLAVYRCDNGHDWVMVLTDEPDHA